MGTPELLILAGALAGGFVVGLTGFGGGLTALPFWLTAAPPVLAAPLVVVTSLLSHLTTLKSIWRLIDWQRAGPFIAGGALGVPVGTLILTFVTAAGFKVIFGVFLAVYAAVNLARAQPVVQWGGWLADGVVGVLGGVLGGFAGLSGPPVTIWANLQGWSKDQKRGVFGGFNMMIQVFATASMGWNGYLTADLSRLVLIATPGTLIGTWIGRWTFDRVGEGVFNRAVLILLLCSGVVTTVTGAMAL